MSIDETRMSLGDHVEELRRRLIRALIGVAVGMVLCLIGWKYLWAVLSWPLAIATGGNPPQMQVVAPPEAFTTALKVCMIAGTILSSPYGLYQIWGFVGAGLYDNEKRAVRKYVLPSVLLFAAGTAFFFIVVAPIVLRFFLLFAEGNYPAPPQWLMDWLGGRFAEGAPATTQPVASAYVVSHYRVTDYVSFVATLSLVYGVAFETPLVVLFLARTGIVPIESMRRYRLHVVLVMLIASALLTPPDVLSQIALTVPVYGLYEIGLFVASLGRRGKG